MTKRLVPHPLVRSWNAEFVFGVGPNTTEITMQVICIHTYIHIIIWLGKGSEQYYW